MIQLILEELVTMATVSHHDAKATIFDSEPAGLMAFFIRRVVRTRDSGRS